MKTYIALLRGINVSDQKKIKMANLKFFFEELKFSNVETYIQSGNVVFDFRKTSARTLENNIQDKILEKYGFQVPVIVKTPDELRQALTNNPFLNKESDKLCVTFLSEQPSPDRIKNLAEINLSPEEYFIDKKIIYLYLPNGAGKAKMSNNFIENKLIVTATSRNWKTVNTVFEMTSKSE